MGSERRIAISRRRRGFGCAVAFFAALVVVVSGCGRSGHGAATDSEKAADVEVLNTLLAQELTVVETYERSLSDLRGAALALAREFRGQSQAHVDALTRAIRGVGGETDAEASVLESSGPRSQAETLVLDYEAENAALAQALDAAPHLQTSAPQALAAALAASHAQHVALLRQSLGVSPLAAVPEPFESGDAPPPKEG
jgi:Ferritin-like domain